MLYKFIYRAMCGINVWKSGELLTTISCGENISKSTDVFSAHQYILSLCQKWLDEKELYDVEYKVFVELH